MQGKDRKVIGNSQHRFTKLHFSSVITYYEEMTGSVNLGTAESVICFQFLKTFTRVTWHVSYSEWD